MCIYGIVLDVRGYTVSKALGQRNNDGPTIKGNVREKLLFQEAFDLCLVYSNIVT